MTGTQPHELISDFMSSDNSRRAHIYRSLNSEIVFILFFENSDNTYFPTVAVTYPAFISFAEFEDIAEDYVDSKYHPRDQQPTKAILQEFNKWK